MSTISWLHCLRRLAGAITNKRRLDLVRVEVNLGVGKDRSEFLNTVGCAAFGQLISIICGMEIA